MFAVGWIGFKIRDSKNKITLVKCIPKKNMNWIKFIEAAWKFLGISEYEPKVRNYIVLQWSVIVFLIACGYFVLIYLTTQNRLCDTEKTRIYAESQRQKDTLLFEIRILNQDVRNEIRNCQIEVNASTKDYIELLKQFSKVKNK